MVYLVEIKPTGQEEFCVGIRTEDPFHRLYKPISGDRAFMLHLDEHEPSLFDYAIEELAECEFSGLIKEGKRNYQKCKIKVLCTV